jgi:methyltransferase
MIVLLAVAAAIYVPMLCEAEIARRHERAQLARGGVEPAGDVYRVMRLAYPLAFAAMLIEGAFGSAVPRVALGWLVFAAGKALKWWAIATLGPFWTFRVIVIPGAPLVAKGPYRFLRHPNYIGVVGELVGIALVTGARVAGPVATAVFCALMIRRVQVEHRALQAASQVDAGGRTRNGAKGGSHRGRTSG